MALAQTKIAILNSVTRPIALATFQKLRNQENTFAAVSESSSLFISIPFQTESDAIVMESGGKLWGGRFSDRRVDQVMERFNSSVSYDRRLCYVDILVFCANGIFSLWNFVFD
jgi:hypothetical protein